MSLTLRSVQDRDDGAIAEASFGLPVYTRRGGKASPTTRFGGTYGQKLGVAATGSPSWLQAAWLKIMHNKRQNEIRLNGFVLTQRVLRQ